MVTGKEMAQALENFANGCSKTDVEEFVDYIVHNTHRTLQQGIMRIAVTLIEKYATLKEGEYDLRNEATVKLCKRIVAATGDKYDRGLPLI
jgi:diphthamide synthase subunit DPH2